MPRPITLTGFSTALFSTWYFVDEFGVLFDCGDGACAGLLQKSRKVKHIFLSHADRDHVAGLLQFHQLNGRPGLQIHYPKDCGSFAPLADFMTRFDPPDSGTCWHPISPDAEYRVRSDLAVRAIENRHVPTQDDRTKSLSFVVESASRKLKAEFQGLPGPQIAAARKQFGDETITEETHRIELIYSGDTPVETDGRYTSAKVLIHEATFLTREEATPQAGRHAHSSLDAVIEMAAESQIETLVLGHFSSRYSNEEIEFAVTKHIERTKLQSEVKIILPGQLARNVLASR